jgi:hypothetical protein
MSSNTLSGVSPASTFDQLLHCGTGTLAAGFTVRLGDGTASPLTISSTGISSPIVSATTSVSAPTISATTSVSAPRATFNASTADNKITIQGYGAATGTGIIFTPASDTATVTACRFTNTAGTTVGSITTTASATAYATSSDYRLKQNVAPMTDAVSRVSALKPSRFNFIGSQQTVDGFLAHEAAEVVPESVTGTKDAINDDGTPNYQGIDQAKLVPLLVAAIQEQQAQISALEARLDALS